MSSKQISLEKKIIRDGKNRFHSRNAGIRGKAETVGVIGRKLLENSVDQVAEAIEAWFKREEERFEKKQHLKVRSGFGAFLKFREMNEYVSFKVISAITCRSILDSISISKKATRTAVMLSEYLEREHILGFVEKEEPRWMAFYKNSLATKQLARDMGTIAYREKRLNALLDEKGWQNLKWSSDEKVQLGTVLIELFCNSTGLATVKNKLNIRGRKYAALSPSPQCLELINNWTEIAEILKPMYRPCLEKPKKWKSSTEGGYFSEELQQDLVKAYNREYKKQLEKADLTEVLNCVNKIQETPFRVNQAVFSIMQELWESGREAASIPAREDEPLPSPPIDVDTNVDARNMWRRASRDVHEENDKQRSRRLGFVQTLALAQEYGEDTFYFVTTLDWRGRYYPTTYFYLSPQGPDFGKALIEFEEGKVISESGKKWFFIHGANTFGMDKLSLEDRVKWVEENEELILSTAKDPFYDRRWEDASEPFQFLAFAIEYDAWKDDPENFISHLPIQVDATQSGLQILSLLMRDEVGSKQTNLTNNDKPEDLYQTVADEATRLLLNDAQISPKELEQKVQKLELKFEKKFAGKNKDTEAYKRAERELQSKSAQIRRTTELCNLWLDLGIDRKMVKRVVMTKVYNASNHSATDYLKQAALEKGLDIPKKHLYTSSSFLNSYVQKAMKNIIKGGFEVMDYLGQIASAACEAKISLRWTTPVGLPILQDYKKRESRKVKTKIDGSIKVRSISEETDETNDRKMKQAFAPNFVHSLDAAVLTKTVNSMKGSSFFMVHDSFGTHAADVEDMLNCIRQSYVEIFSKDLLQELKEEIQKYLPEQYENAIPDTPEYGNFDLDTIHKSNYMFS